MKKMLLYTVVLSLVPLWAQAQYTWNNTGSISTSSTCSASINNGSIVTNSSGAICQCSNVVASTYNWNCSASASSGTEVKVNGGSALTTSNQTGVLPYLCSDTSGSGSTQFCSTTPSFTPQAGNCITYMTTTSPSGAVTLNVNSLGAKTVRIWQGGSIYAVSGAPYNYPSGAPMAACYDGTYWNIGAANASTVVQTNGGPVQISNQTGALPYLCADTSTSGTAQSCTTTPGFTPQTGNCVVYSTTTANSGTGLTVNINSLGAKSVAVAGSSGWTTTLVTSSSIPSNKPMHLCYDGTNWDASGTGFAATGGGGGGGGLNGVNAQTTSYTAVSGDNGKAITFNCASACTITMPTSVPANGWTIFASNESANAILSVAPTSGSNLYLGTGTAALGTGALNPGMGVSIWSDGTNYHVNQGGIMTGSSVVPVLVQSHWGSCGVGECDLAFTEAVTPGDAIVVEYMHSDEGTQVISDSNGDVFPSPNYTNIGGNFDITQYVVCSAVGGPTTILNTGTYTIVAVYEIANVASSSCQDGFNSGTAYPSTSPLSTGSVTTTHTNDFILVTGAFRDGDNPVTFTEANGYSLVLNTGNVVGTLDYATFHGVNAASGSLSDTVSFSGESAAGAIYAGILALKPASNTNALTPGDLLLVGLNGAFIPYHQGASGTAPVSNGTGALPTPQTVLTTNPISGMTSGQVAIASAANAIGSSKPLAGSGAGIVTGPASSTSGDVTEYTGTAGQTADSGVLLTALAPKASPAFTGTPDASGATQFKLPVAASLATAANGEVGYDSTNKNWHVWLNGADVLLVPLASGFVSGDCPEPTSTGGTWILVDAGGPCGTSGGGSAFSAITSGTNTATLTMGTGGKLTYSGTGIVNANQVNGFAPQPFVAANAYGANSSSVTSVTSSSMSVAVGDLVQVLCRTAGSSVNVTDSLSNSWSSATCQTGGASQICASYSTITTGGSGTFTCNWTTANTFDSVIALDVKNTLGTLNAHVGATGSAAINFVQAYSLSSSQRTADIYCFTVASNAVYFTYSNLDGTVLIPYTSYVSGENYPDSGCIFHNATTSETTVPTNVVTNTGTATWTGLLMGYNY